MTITEVTVGRTVLQQHRIEITRYGGTDCVTAAYD